MGAAQVMLAVAHSPPLALSARIVLGVGDALTFISVMRLVPAWFPPERGGKITTAVGPVNQLGFSASGNRPAPTSSGLEVQDRTGRPARSARPSRMWSARPINVRHTIAINRPKAQPRTHRRWSSGAASAPGRIGPAAARRPPAAAPRRVDGRRLGAVREPHHDG